MTRLWHTQDGGHILGRLWQKLRWFFEKPQFVPESEVDRSIRTHRHARPQRPVHADPDNIVFLKLKAAVVQRRFEKARAILRELGSDPTPAKDATDVAALLCEAVADDLRDWDRDGSIWLYEQAVVYFQEFAVWASTRGEGSSRMDAVSRVEGKLKQMRAADII